MQTSSLAQVLPQSPQLSGSVFLFTQPPLQLERSPLQLVVS
jgi:hypothetical protein